MAGFRGVTFLTAMDPATGLIDDASVGETGRALSAGYNSAEPFPHIVIDDFLPTPILDLCLSEFCEEGQEGGVSYNLPQERRKREYQPEKMSQRARQLFYAFNSKPFVTVVQNITGLNGLIPDPYFLGGGFHELEQGGHLGVHADFNHHKLMNVERRVNVLIYLNPGWRDEYGGQLELWNEKMTASAKSIVPMLNRCVIFNTTSTSYHGNPNPVNHPNHRSRKSIALYYYSATWDRSKRSHTTKFRVRPGSNDRPDTAVRRAELVEDLLPPALLRTARKVKRAFRGSAKRTWGGDRAA